MLTETRIIQRLNHFEVQGQRQTVQWPDGSQADLHSVAVRGHEDPFLRAFLQGGTHWVVFDLRDIGPRTLEADIKALPPRDTQGVVLYALRLTFVTEEDFAVAALAAHKAAALATDGTQGRLFDRAEPQPEMGYFESMIRFAASLECDSKPTGRAAA